MMECNGGRRTVLAALEALAISCALPASAQDPRYTEALAAARAWLALADANDTAATFNTASKRFQEAMPVEQWGSAMASARGQFGATQRRTLVGTTQPSPSKDLPPGEFVIVAYRTELEKRLTGTETVTLEHEADGKWRVVGYLMR